MMKAGKNPEPRKKLLKISDFNYQVGNSISLPAVDEKHSSKFFEILKNRKSERQFRKLRITQLAKVLWFCAKARGISIADNDQILFHTNVPSAGSIHPIDILISLPGPITKRKLHYYDPFTHKLWELTLDKRKLFSFIRIIDQNIKTSNSTIFWFAGDILRTNEKYKNPESLVWRDAGALIMTVQLVATAFNIRSCAVGTLAEPFFAKLFNNSKSYISAGGVLLG